MNFLDVKKIERYKDFLLVEDGRFNILFSTAENYRSFNRNTVSGIGNLESLKEDFDVDEVVYLNQVHSDKIYEYKSSNYINDNEGDAIITDEKAVIIGAFTADCVPVILVDEKKSIIAAIHSGWKGTYNSITKKTIKRLVEDYDVDPKNIKAFIGPHIRKCCYEVSEELKEQFVNKTNLAEEKLFNGRNLNLEMCIEDDLIKSSVEQKNIFTLQLCTCCEEKIKLHSHRRTNGNSGRLFSFVFIKR